MLIDYARFCDPPWLSKNLFKVSKITLEQHSFERCFNMILWLWTGFWEHLPSRQKPVQNQKKNVRTTFSERYSNVTLLTLNRVWPAGQPAPTCPTFSEHCSNIMFLPARTIFYAWTNVLLQRQEFYYKGGYKGKIIHFGYVTLSPKRFSFSTSKYLLWRAH